MLNYSVYFLSFFFFPPPPNFCVHRGMDCGQKNIIPSVAVPLAPFRFLVNGHLSRVLRHSSLSANDKGNKEVIAGICVAAEENSGKP